MNVVLTDDSEIWKGFLPLTFTRPLSEIRIGIFTIKEKWDRQLNTHCVYHTQEYLRKKYPGIANDTTALFINSCYLPDAALVEAVLQLKGGEALYKDQEMIAFQGKRSEFEQPKKQNSIQYTHPVFSIKNVWDIFQKNAAAIENDFDWISKQKKSEPLSNTVTVIGDKNRVYLEEGAKAEACILNTTQGPVYIGREAEIMEGSVVRGPLALCEHATLKLSTKIYGATTVGPYSKVGGEVSNSVIQAYSNKGHDGFLGNSVIGEWCNLGADTNNSNLKNNYGNVKLFNYAKNKQVDTGLQFCGLIMGDHSKAGINTMFNTGTVAGVGCNIYGGGFPPTVIPSFSWGGSAGFEDYRLEKLYETAEKMYARRGLQLSDTDKEILNFIYEGGVKL